MPCLRGGKDEIVLHKLSIFDQNLIDPTNSLLRHGFQEHCLARIDSNEKEPLPADLTPKN